MPFILIYAKCIMQFDWAKHIGGMTFIFGMMILRKGLNPYGKLLRHFLAECALRRTAENCRNEFPSAYDVLSHDTYVDDCMSGTEGFEQTRQVTDELQVTLAFELG